MVTNHEFGRRVGCDHTMASRLRNGHRKPSVQMLIRICTEFNLDGGVALEKLALGREPFSAWLRAEVFDNTDDSDEAEAA